MVLIMGESLKNALSAIPHTLKRLKYLLFKSKNIANKLLRSRYVYKSICSCLISKGSKETRTLLYFCITLMKRNLQS